MYPFSSRVSYSPLRYRENSCLKKLGNYGLRAVKYARTLKGNIVYGHVGYDPDGISKLCAQAHMGVFYVTFMRDPIERVVSFANWKQVPLDAFELGNWHDFAQNLATSMTNGVVGASWRTWSSSSDPRTCAYDPRQNSAAVIFAKRRLAREFAFVGDSGRFSESVWLLQHVFGWAKHDPLFALKALRDSRRGFTRPGPKSADWSRWGVRDLMPSTIEAIEAVELCDRALYNFAAALFESRTELLSLRDRHSLKRFIGLAGSP
jgi:hypothetical protein